MSADVSDKLNVNSPLLILEDIKSRLKNSEKYEVFSRPKSQLNGGMLYYLKDAPPGVKSENAIFLFNKDYSSSQMKAFMESITEWTNNYAFIFVKNNKFLKPTSKFYLNNPGLEQYTSEHKKTFVKLNNIEKFFVGLQNASPNVPKDHQPMYSLGGFLTYYDPKAEPEKRIITDNLMPVVHTLMGSSGEQSYVSTDTFGIQKIFTHKGNLSIIKSPEESATSFYKDEKHANYITSDSIETKLISPFYENNGN